MIMPTGIPAACKSIMARDRLIESKHLSISTAPPESFLPAKAADSKIMEVSHQASSAPWPGIPAYMPSMAQDSTQGLSCLSLVVPHLRYKVGNNNKIRYLRGSALGTSVLERKEALPWSKPSGQGSPPSIPFSRQAKKLKHSRDRMEKSSGDHPSSPPAV